MRTGGFRHRELAGPWWRQLATLAAVLLLLPGPAAALGLGELLVESRLNQPLKARIALVSAKTEDFEQMRASLADAAVHDSAGIARSRLLLGLRFDIVQSAEGHYVSVRSTDWVREPALAFVLDLSWPGGRLLREYGVLLTAP